MFQLDRVDASYVSRAPHRFVHSISCALTAQELFCIVTDGNLDSEWFPDFVSARWETPPPHDAGSIRTYRLKYMTIREEFLVWEPGKRLVFRLNECSLPMLRCFVENYIFTPRPDGGTDMQWEACYTPNPWLRIFHPLIRPFFAKDFDRASNNLQALVTRLAAEASAAKGQG